MAGLQPIESDSVSPNPTPNPTPNSTPNSTQVPPGQGAWTVDQLAQLTGKTVRTLRYYGALGLLPQPERRGRQVYYDDRHRARLDVIDAMQAQGFSLGEIDHYLKQLPPDLSPSELEVRRAVMSAWVATRPVTMTRADLESRAGRTLTDADIELLEQLDTVVRRGDEFEVAATFDVGIGLLDLDIPVTSMVAAGRIIRDSMDAMVAQLRRVMSVEVLGDYRQRVHGREDSQHLERTVARLRQLTLESVVANFNIAAGRGVGSDAPGLWEEFESIAAD